MSTSSRSTIERTVWMRDVTPPIYSAPGGLNRINYTPGFIMYPAYFSAGKAPIVWRGDIWWSLWQASTDVRVLSRTQNLDTRMQTHDVTYHPFTTIPCQFHGDVAWLQLPPPSICVVNRPIMSTRLFAMESCNLMLCLFYTNHDCSDLENKSPHALHKQALQQKPH